MASPVADYRDKTYQEMFQAWSKNPQYSELSEFDLWKIHKKWKQIGKLVAAGRF